MIVKIDESEPIDPAAGSESLEDARAAWEVTEYRDDQTGATWGLWPGGVWRSASVGYGSLAELRQARGVHLVPTRVSSIPALVRYTEALERVLRDRSA